MHEIASHSAVRIRFHSKEGYAFFCMTLVALKIFQFGSNGIKLTSRILGQLFVSALIGIIDSILVISGLYFLQWGKSRGAANNSSKPTPMELVQGNGNAMTLGSTGMDTRPHTEAGTGIKFGNFPIFQEEFGSRDISKCPNGDVSGTKNDSC